MNELRDRIAQLVANAMEGKPDAAECSIGEDDYDAADRVLALLASGLVGPTTSAEMVFSDPPHTPFDLRCFKCAEPIVVGSDDGVFVHSRCAVGSATQLPQGMTSAKLRKLADGYTHVARAAGVRAWRADAWVEELFKWADALDAAKVGVVTPPTENA
jgi:hypothetical protein